MDKIGVTPDVTVDTDPNQLAQGIDAQLDRAVQVLTADVAEWKKTHSRIAQGEGVRPPMTPGTTTPGTTAPPPMGK